MTKQDNAFHLVSRVVAIHINELMPPKRTGRKKASPSRKKATATSTTKKISNCPIVGIGGSAGGFVATVGFFKRLPAEKREEFRIFEDLDPHHTTRFPGFFGKKTKMPVVANGRRKKT